MLIFLYLVDDDDMLLAQRKIYKVGLDRAWPIIIWRRTCLIIAQFLIIDARVAAMPSSLLRIMIGLISNEFDC